MKEATYAREIVYLTAAAIPHSSGESYFFVGVDDFSKFFFTLGPEDSLDDDTFIRVVKKLLDHKEFKAAGNSPFTLVVPFDQSLESQITKLLPSYGRLVFDQALVTERASPLVTQAMRKRG